MEQKKNIKLLLELQAGVFGGIASPGDLSNLFIECLENWRYKKRFLDHHRYEKDELDRLFQQAKN